MSATHSKTVAMIDWTDGRLPLSPRSLFLRLLESGLTVTSLARIRNFIEGINGRRAIPPGIGGDPGESPEDPPRESLWDDPALWMLMMH